MPSPKLNFHEKIALVAPDQESHWISCKTITPALAKAYINARPKSKGFAYNPSMSDFAIASLAKNIKIYNPKKIVFYSHAPHPFRLVSALAKLFPRVPECYFHTYGDFTLFPSEWERTFQYCHQVTLVCASVRQKNLVSRFVGEKVRIEVIPFCLSQEFFSWDLSERINFRSGFDIDDKTEVFLYTGRLSPEKNVIRLGQEFLKFARTRNAQLFIVGPFDDIGPEKFFGRPAKGFFKKKWESFIASLTPIERKKINYLGSEGSSALKSAYCGADIFVSLSTYHDEDFGMSPLEALYCGLPCLLSDWGGYAGFALTRSVELVAPKLKKDGYWISSQQIQNSTRKLLEVDNSREMVSRLYRSHFSIENIARKIDRMLRKKSKQCHGFTSLGYEYIDRYKSFQSGQPLYPEGPSADSFYAKIYQSYLSSQ